MTYNFDNQKVKLLPEYCFFEFFKKKMNSKEVHFIVWFSHWLDRILILFYYDDYMYELMLWNWNFPSLNRLNIQWQGNYYDTFNLTQMRCPQHCTCFCKAWNCTCISYLALCTWLSKDTFAQRHDTSEIKSYFSSTKCQDNF